MGRIVVLDDQMVNMIAAGEVIERPASVLKELLENSIDAGGRCIRVDVEDGGCRLIAVADDGCGMDAEDIRTAFFPHATSKVRCTQDLQGVRTMGFRGEALASIAAVAQVTVTSRPVDAVEGYRLRIDCGRFDEVGPCATGPGTTIEVRNLFAKLPARRKFLRTTNTEMGHISEQFTRVALAHPDLDLTLTHNGRTLHRLTAGGGLVERIGELLGRAVADDLIEVRRQEKGMTLRALLGKPATVRGTGQFQYVFLNRRYIRDRFISHAVREAYRGLIEPNKFPVVFLFLEMPPEAFDVNVHPAKVEVRFANANLVHSQVLAALRDKLLSMNLDAPGMLPKAPVPPPMPGPPPGDDEARRQRIAQAMADFFQKRPSDGGQRALEFRGRPSGSRLSGPEPQEPAPLSFPAPARLEETAPREPQAPSTADQAPAEPSRLLQIHDSYILVQTPEGFDIIDQHALHERILYERLCRKLADGPLASQRLLMPEILDVSDAQAEAIHAHGALFEKLGIEVAPFGPGTVAVQSFPVLLADIDVAAFVRDLLDRLTAREAGLDAERLLHEVLDMAACKAAIKAGQPLSEAEMAQLLADKAVVERASRCPHGRPTTLRFTLAELEKQFKRTGF